MIVELWHPSDPRYVLVDELPERISVEELGKGRYGKVMVYAPGPVDAVYPQPDGFGTDWVKEVRDGNARTRARRDGA